MIDITNRQHSQRLCFVLRIFVEQKWSVRKMFEWFAFKLNKISLFFIPKFTWNLEFVHDFIHILLIPVHVFVLQLNIMLLWCRFFLAVPFSEWGEKHKQKQSPIICCAVRCVANWNKRLWKRWDHGNRNVDENKMITRFDFMPCTKAGAHFNLNGTDRSL